MKSLRFSLFLFALPLLSLAEGPPPVERVKLIVDENTAVRVRLGRNLSWANVRTGDRIPFEVLQDVIAKNRVDGKNYLVIERGAIALGTITDIEQDRHLGRGDTMAVTLDFVRFADGEKVALHPNTEEPYFLPLNIKDKTIYPAGTERTVVTFGEADLDSQYFKTR
jgi:hypothetical protein